MSDRTAVIKECIAAVQAERLHDGTGTEEDKAYMQAIKDCVRALRRLPESRPTPGSETVREPKKLPNDAVDVVKALIEKVEQQAKMDLSISSEEIVVLHALRHYLVKCHEYCRAQPPYKVSVHSTEDTAAIDRIIAAAPASVGAGTPPQEPPKEKPDYKLAICECQGDDPIRHTHYDEPGHPHSCARCEHKNCPAYAPKGMISGAVGCLNCRPVIYADGRIVHQVNCSKPIWEPAAPMPPRGVTPQEEPIVDLREGSSEPQRVGDGGESGMDRPTLHRDSLACSPGETDRHSTVSPQPAAPLGATEPPASEPQAASVSALVEKLRKEAEIALADGDASYLRVSVKPAELLAALTPTPAGPWTLEQVDELRTYCHGTYNGGHEDAAERRAFHHGMDTVCNVIQPQAATLPAAPERTPR